MTTGATDWMSGAAAVLWSALTSSIVSCGDLALGASLRAAAAEAAEAAGRDA